MLDRTAGACSNTCEVEPPAGASGRASRAAHGGIEQGYQSIGRRGRGNASAASKRCGKAKSVPESANSAPVMIVMSDTDKRATFFNKGWLDFTGRTLEQKLDQGWTAGVHPDDLEMCLAGLSSSYAERRECHLQYRLRRADGEYRWVICKAMPRFEPDGVFAGYVGSVIDTTELKQAQEEAIARQKLEGLGMLAGGIAHDFNNLLGGIVAESELLLAEVAGNSSARQGVERIRAVAVRASEIVRQLLVYAGQETRASEQFYLDALVREMQQLLKVSIAKNVVLKVNLSEGLPPIEANAAQLRQVVMNLIANASDALKGKGGVISINLTEALLGQKSSADNQPGAFQGNSLRLEVCDTGCGMTEETQARIFDPFFTTKASRQGLGLAAVRGIIVGHGGTINVQSAPGQGARFEILLPCAARPASKRSGAVEQPAAVESASLEGTVLLIDDEDLIRLAVAKMLRKKGFSILEAGDGATGVDLFRNHLEVVDVVLLDLTLPGMSGREVLEALRKMRPGIRVILTTAYSQEQARAAVGGDQSWPYIRKPFQISELLDLLQEVLRPRQPSSLHS
jgi:two-component system, cell cycle sensor histidine kinase and response regulator CckA